MKNRLLTSHVSFHSCLSITSQQARKKSGGGEGFPCDVPGRRTRKSGNLIKNACPEEKSIFSIVTWMQFGANKTEAVIEHQKEFNANATEWQPELSKS